MKAIRRLIVDRLRVEASVGILPHELITKQPLLVSVWVELRDVDLVPEQDAVKHVLDYCFLRDTVLQEAHAGHVNMLETLAGRIAQRLLTRPVIDNVRVRVIKPNIFPDCDGVAVEVESHG
jgi:dihydroneopterin aldolase